MLKEEVDSEEVANIVSKWTGIPVIRLLEGEIEKLIRMEDRLHERVIGQDDAIVAVAAAVRRRAQACRTRAVLLARSFSSARRAWARGNWLGRWPSSCSTTRRIWCVST